MAVARNNSRASVGRYPGNDVTYYARALAKKSLGDHQGAIEDYGKVIEIDPNNVAAYYSRGLAKKALGDQQGAKEDLSTAKRLIPD